MLLSPLYNYYIPVCPFIPGKPNEEKLIFKTNDINLLIWIHHLACLELLDSLFMMNKNFQLNLIPWENVYDWFFTCHPFHLVILKIEFFIKD